MRCRCPLLSAVFATFAAWMLLSCGPGSPLTPRSGGRPYEVTVVGDSDGLVAGMLSVPVEGLPQEEPCFDVTAIDRSHYGATARLSRHIVVLTADSSRYTRTQLRYARDTYATPQTIVYLNTPSVRQLRADASRVAPRLRGLLSRSERATTIAQLRRSHHQRAEQAVAETFGIHLLVPPALGRLCRGDHFLWLSDDVPEGMSGLCFYTIPPGMDVIAGRDSVMRRNLRGESPGMYVRTVDGSCHRRTVPARGSRATVVRGLWEMTGDAMGGPFVLHATTDSATRVTLVCEALLYAPSGMKRDKLRLLEASLYTIKRNKQTDYGRK